MPHNPEIFQRYWKKPFRYCPMASAVYDADNHMVLDVRGYGYLTGQGSLALPDRTACTIQDQLGCHLANLLTCNWPE